MTCECRQCRNDADWIRPEAIQGCANALCNGCMIRIYTGYPHHTSAWEKAPVKPPKPEPKAAPIPTEQPTLF